MPGYALLAACKNQQVRWSTHRNVCEFQILDMFRLACQFFGIFTIEKRQQPLRIRQSQLFAVSLCRSTCVSDVQPISGSVVR